MRYKKHAHSVPVWTSDDWEDLTADEFPLSPKLELDGAWEGITEPGYLPPDRKKAQRERYLREKEKQKSKRMAEKAEALARQMSSEELEAYREAEKLRQRVSREKSYNVAAYIRLCDIFKNDPKLSGFVRATLTHDYEVYVVCEEGRVFQWDAGLSTTRAMRISFDYEELVPDEVAAIVAIVNKHLVIKP